MTDSSEKILIVGPAWVGDMVMSQSLYMFLQATRSNVRIDVLAPPWSEPIIARMPQVHKAIVKPIGHGELGLGRRWKIARELRDTGYDQAILLPNSFKSALVPFFTGIPKRTGWRGEMRFGLLNDLRTLDEAGLPLMVQRFVALGMESGASLPEELPAPHLVVDAERARKTGSDFGFDERPILALCPGAEFGSAKRWPAQYYGQLANQYLQRGWQVVLYGSAKDAAVTAEIAHSSGGDSACLDLAGRTTLEEVVDLMSLSQAVVSNDSGLMHIAAALHCPVLVIYGATSERFTPPLSKLSECIVPSIDCAPCFSRECPLGHHRCMVETSAELVAARLDGLLSRSASVNSASLGGESTPGDSTPGDSTPGIHT